MADSYGIAGVRATSPDELRRELRAALKRRGPSLIEVPVGEMPDPWPTLIMRGCADGRKRPYPAPIRPLADSLPACGSFCKSGDQLDLRCASFETARFAASSG